MPSLNYLATLQPPSNARTWLTTPHPRLPIVATACSDKTVRVYSLQTFQLHSTISGGHKRSIRSCAWKPNSLGESVLATGSFDASCGIWRRWEEAGGAATEVDFTGKGLAGGDKDEDADEDEWRLEVILDGHDSEIKSVAFCPTAPLLATCSRDKSVWVWEELAAEDGGEGEWETVAVLQEHEGDVKCVAWHPSEKCLVSGSYDDVIRVWKEDGDDWACCAALDKHEGTVWWVEFEEEGVCEALEKSVGGSDQRRSWLEEREKSGPRLMSCSDDGTVRVWRRTPKEKKEMPTGQGRMPSIWKNRDFEEEWTEEAQLPKLHERPVYAINWSRKTGRVVSAGSDGKILVYEERWRGGSSQDVDMTDDTATANGPAAKSLTEWVVIADVENAHDVFEINHVAWAPRCDRARRSEDEEVVLSTGDDGEVKVWTLDD